MPTIGGGKAASEIVASIRSTMDEVMATARGEIAGATSELVGEVVDGSKAIARSIRAEAADIRREFAEVLGNAAPAEAIPDEGGNTDGAGRDAAKHRDAAAVNSMWGQEMLKLATVGSSGRGNSRCEFSGRCYEAKSFSWTSVKLERDSVQILLAIAR